jgi:hypothetical protein
MTIWFGFLHLHHLPIVGLARLSFTDHFRRSFEDAQQLAFRMRVLPPNTRALVWRTTFPTRSSMVFIRASSSSAACFSTSAERHTTADSG